jgi:hypothetical protein
MVGLQNLLTTASSELGGVGHQWRRWRNTMWYDEYLLLALLFGDKFF